MVTATPRAYAGFVGLLLIAALAALPAPGSAQSAHSEAPVTFTKDIAPILQRSCQSCHRPGEMAPMSLVTYEEVRPWARSIRNRVVAREMPPWHIDRNIGIQQFKDNPSLSEAEIAKVAAWVDNGAPRGNPADMPPPRVFPDTAAWQIGEPDLIVRYPTLPVPAEGADVFGSTYSPLEIEQDRYIKAIQHRPVGEGSQRVVHHALSFVVDLDEQTQMPSASGHFLVEYASRGRKSIPRTSGCCCRPARSSSWIITSTRWASRSTPWSSWASCSFRRASSRSTFAGRSSSAGTRRTSTSRPANWCGRTATPCSRRRRKSWRSSRTCTRWASTSASSSSIRRPATRCEPRWSTARGSTTTGIWSTSTPKKRRRWSRPEPSCMSSAGTTTRTRIAPTRIPATG